MKTKKVLTLLSIEVQTKILNNTINDWDEDHAKGALGFYQYKLNRKFDRQGLCGFFRFHNTPEGSKYWNELSEALVKVIYTL
jgi:hypothetical protein